MSPPFPPLPALNLFFHMSHYLSCSASQIEGQLLFYLATMSSPFTGSAYLLQRTVLPDAFLRSSIL